MNDKIQPHHLQRAAFIYVRQSNPHQVRNHPESRELQYALQSRAQEMGFREIVTIDDDLGITGTGLRPRPGFAKLLAAVCAGEVGAVFSREATRMARNNRDAHHLIDLCALTETLVIDCEDVYDPRLPNDRLLLGMKASMAEFELGLIRQRAHEARKAMIQRGTVLWEVPVGYIRTEDRRIEMTPDRQVRHAIDTVFKKFQQLGSARQLLLWYRQEEIPLPIVKPATRGKVIQWGLPIYGRILKILKNPCYAGAFAYGKTYSKTVMKEGRGYKMQGQPLPMEKWEIVLQDHHEGYIDWQQYLHNQKTLERNNSMRGEGKVPKKGPALLAGLLRCGRCGRKLHVAYSGVGGRVPRYHCRGANINHGTDFCLSVGGLRLDLAVGDEVLKAVSPLGVHAALEAQKRLEKKANDIVKSLQLALEKARYEAERARRQFDAVEPENRLVAMELEKRWNDALGEVTRLERRLQESTTLKPPLTAEEEQRLFAMAKDLPTLWNHPQANVTLKKRLLYTVLEEIVIDVVDDPPQIHLKLHWVGGVHTTITIAKNKTGKHRNCTAGDVVELIRELVKVCGDPAIAAILNRLGYRTGTGKSWTQSRVYSLRRTHQIIAEQTAREAWCTLEQAAMELQVNKWVIRKLIMGKILPAKQVVKYAPWVIERKNLQLPQVQSVIQSVRKGGKVPRKDPTQPELPFNAEK